MADIRQRAEGNNIAQAGRDIKIVLPQPVTTENLIECPDCKHPVSMNAIACPACGFQVERYFLSIIQAKQQQKNQRIVAALYFATSIGSIIALYFMLPDTSFRNPILFLLSGGVIFAFAYNYIVRKLKNMGL